MKKKTLFYLIVLVFWGLVTVLMVELVFQMVRPEPRYATWLEMHDRGFMQNRADFTTSHRGYGRNVRYRMGALGNRLTGNESAEGDRSRVLVLGDSFTFGLHLADAYTLTSLLNQQFEEVAPRPYFINAAVGGTGLADHLANLQTHGDRFDADAVLVVLSIDDLARAVAKNLFVVVDGELVASKRWEESGVKRFMERIPGYFFLSEHSAFFNAVVTYLWSEAYFTDVTNGFDPASGYVIPPEGYLQHRDDAYLFDLVTLLFAEMKSWTSQRGIPLIVVSNGYYLSDQNAYTHYLMRIMPDIAADLGIPYYNPGEKLKEAIDGDFSKIQIEGEWHPDETGNMMLVELLYPWLRELFANG